MDKVLSNLLKKEDNTEQIDLPQLCKNILKCETVNLLNKIAIDSTTATTRLRNLLRLLWAVSLFMLINATTILDFISCLVL